MRMEHAATDDVSQTKCTVKHADEAALLERSVAGDRIAFEALYRRNVGRIYTYIVYNVKTVEDAEELTQEVFVLAWRKLGQFQGKSSFSTWLMAIAVGSIRMWRRSIKRRPAAAGDPLELELLSGPIGPAAGEGPAPEALIDLRDAIRRLPDRARTVLILHEIAGYRHEEIGRIMATSDGTSKAQLARAKQLLREAMKHD